MGFTPSCCLSSTLWHSQGQINLLLHQTCKHLLSWRALIICGRRQRVKRWLEQLLKHTRAVLTLLLSIPCGSTRPANQHVCTGQAVTASNCWERCEHGEKGQDCAQRIGLWQLRGLWNSFLFFFVLAWPFKITKPKILFANSCISDGIHALFPFQAF